MTDVVRDRIDKHRAKLIALGVRPKEARASSVLTLAGSVLSARIAVLEPVADAARALLAIDSDGDATALVAALDTLDKEGDEDGGQAVEGC